MKFNIFNWKYFFVAFLLIFCSNKLDLAQELTIPPPALNKATNYLPKWSPDGSKIIFCSTINDNWEIYSMNADGSNLTRLTNNTASDSAPFWSPGGKRIVFFSERDGNREIYTMKADGSEQTRLTINAAGDFNPSYSPDGKKIVFVSDRTGANEIFIMDENGKNQKALTKESNVSGVTRPTFSPDGRQIAFYSSKTGKDSDKRSLYLMKSNGSQIKPINAPSFDGNQFWSPDGSKFVFDASATGGNTSGNGEWEIFSMNSDGTACQRLTNNTNNDWGAAWSPDGSKIVYCSGLHNQYEIFVMDKDGSNPKRLTRLIYP